KPEIRNLLRTEFTCSGWSPFCCGTFQDAINLINWTNITAIICGENFPDGTGRNLYQYLRSQTDARRTIPFIFYTGYPWVLKFSKGYRDNLLLGIQATRHRPEADFQALHQALQRLCPH
ncbi:MAG: DNA-binding response regulator, partial [Proteobacteria bacterium]|nr:DNA-binding response regulator [Pseudomonadota bacterium]